MRCIHTLDRNKDISIAYVYIPVAAAAIAVLIFFKSRTNSLTTEDYDSERHFYLALEWNNERYNSDISVRSAHTSSI